MPRLTKGTAPRTTFKRLLFSKPLEPAAVLLLSSAHRIRFGINQPIRCASRSSPTSIHSNLDQSFHFGKLSAISQWNQEQVLPLLLLLLQGMPWGRHGCLGEGDAFVTFTCFFQQSLFSCPRIVYNCVVLLEHCISYIWLKQRLFGRSSPRSLSWLKHLARCTCWWASRVLVNSHEACRHGRKEIGLPSHVAIFSKFWFLIYLHVSIQQKNRKALEQPLNKSQISSIHPKLEDDKEIQVHEMEDTSQISICNISLPIAGYSWMGPKIKISLPSFSGQTVYNPNLLKYSCQVECRVRAVEAAKISRLMIAKATITEPENSFDNFKAKEKKYGDRLATEDVGRDQSIEVLLSKPVMALEFNFLKMQVEAPIIIHSESRT
ncbi:hypothetical protein ZIOFF_003875 [Zingiber officinale]|uniref:Uncharacterized protein n=1 Tax=Zingiber officinale TaxID=94328 RepID=A0A8J5HZ52_ZINOF|nr:hypothetical protein ZIOFF_003875 [Zingiber officinale]